MGNCIGKAIDQSCRVCLALKMPYFIFIGFIAYVYGIISFSYAFQVAKIDFYRVQLSIVFTRY